MYMLLGGKTKGRRKRSAKKIVALHIQIKSTNTSFIICKSILYYPTYTMLCAFPGSPGVAGGEGGGDYVLKEVLDGNQGEWDGLVLNPLHPILPGAHQQPPVNKTLRINMKSVHTYKFHGYIANQIPT